MDTYKKIEKLAGIAREWAESFAKQNKFSEDLCGMCALASSKLFELLDREPGLAPKLAVWHDSRSNGVHCFVICNEYLVDITATQFGNFAKIEILNKFKVDTKRYYFWKADTFLKSVDDLMLYQEEIEWVSKSQVTEKRLSWTPALKRKQ